MLITMLLLVCLSAKAQDWYFEPIDYDEIAKNIKVKESNLYYPKLFERFQQADTTMTTQERRHLLYGYTQQAAYSPYARSTYNDSITLDFNKETFERDEIVEFLRVTDSILKDVPFSFRTLSMQVFALEELGQMEEAQKKTAQLNMCINTVLSTGNGINEKDAMYITYVEQEYYLINIFGFDFGGSQQLIGDCDYLTLAENEEQLEGLYFNASACLNSMTK